MIPSIRVFVVLEDGRRLTASTRARDLLTVERAHGRPISALFVEPTLEVIASLTHAALVRTGQFTGSVDDLVDQMSDFGIDEASTAPFAEAPSATT